MVAVIRGVALDADTGGLAIEYTLPGVDDKLRGIATNRTTWIARGIGFNNEIDRIYDTLEALLEGVLADLDDEPDSMDG